MYLVQLLLPLYDNSGRPFAPAKLNRVKTLLTRSFGGITMFRRSPAEGLSEEASGMVRDDIVIFEVMTAQLDRQWCRLVHRCLLGPVRGCRTVSACPSTGGRPAGRAFLGVSFDVETVHTENGGPGRCVPPGPAAVQCCYDRCVTGSWGP